MLKAFNETIKPLNDELGKVLGIEVKDKSQRHHIPVYVPMIKPNGGTKMVASEMVKDYLALGLSLRSKS